MNKTELKNFAVFARRDLLEKVAMRAKLFGIDENNDLKIEEKFGQLVVNGIGYPTYMRSAFNSLAKQLNTKGYEQLLEEVAYTWFNRIIAIRYMEINEYLPSRVNVLSSKTGKAEPDILTQFETMNLDIDVHAVKDLIFLGKIEEAYRILFISKCNALNKILPFLFERINDYTELLLPDYLLDSESLISRLIKNDSLTECFAEVEVIGWFYQFYNSEPKDLVFTNLKKNKKIGKYDIPAATQLFTPKWIVGYMLENSLGNIWLESYPHSSLNQSMKYYIKEEEQNENVKQLLDEVRYENVNIEEITIIDPCVGSGHILVYAFDLLYQMYEEMGYPTNDIPKLILEKNLYGLDIDDRAVQLASFALMMKARKKSRRIFSENIAINVFAIQESNDLDILGLAELFGNDDKEKKEILLILDAFKDAKNLGSIINPPKLNYKKYLTKIKELGEEQLSIHTFTALEQTSILESILKQAILLTSKFDVSITNPPYMGSKGMNKCLSDYLNKYYPITKSDLYAVFIEKLNNLTKQNAFNATVNQHSWMFLSSYESLRFSLLKNQTIVSMIHLGIGAFEDLNSKVVQSTAYVLRNLYQPSYKASYYRLTETYNNNLKRKIYLDRKNKFLITQDKFFKISGAPVAYWISDQTRKVFLDNKSIREKVDITGSQHITANNEKYLRFHWEVNKNDLSKRWIQYAKGGSYRKWFGNNTLVVDWSSEAIKFYKTNKTSNLLKEQYRFREGITWTASTNISFSCRKLEGKGIFDKKGPSLFPLKIEDYNYFMGYLNSKPVNYFLEMFSGTSDFQNIDIIRLPYLNLPEKEKEEIDNYVKENIIISENDWNNNEVAPGFLIHPLLRYNKHKYLSESFVNFCSELRGNYDNLSFNESQINRIFITMFNLNNELNPEPSEKEITLKQSSRINETKSFLSYFIGCVMGRYSLDTYGTVYAGGEWDEQSYRKFIPAKKGLIQLTDEHYFESDIIARLKEFLSITFDAESVEENLQWLAESLELKKNESFEERLRRYFLDEFFKDHCQAYQKRPIYWLVDSGKNKGLRTLIYMHRYQPDTMATIRFEHLQEIQEKYHNDVTTIEARMVNPNLSATEKRELEKRKTDFQKRLDELLEFDKHLAEYANAQISIDLDDGVKANYAKFGKVLAPIK